MATKAKNGKGLACTLKLKTYCCYSMMEDLCHPKKADAKAKWSVTQRGIPLYSLHLAYHCTLHFIIHIALLCSGAARSCSAYPKVCGSCYLIWELCSQPSQSPQSPPHCAAAMG